MREEYETILRFFASDLDRIATRNNILKMMQGQRLAKALGRNFFFDLRRMTTGIVHNQVEAAVA